MCTVTYIPKGNDQFILTSNRDENSQRATGAPRIQLSQSQQALFPQDPKSGGTWIAAAVNNRVACLLNGAFVKHQHNPPYRHSRGLVVLDYFKYANIQEFIDRYDLRDIEPFTLILYEKGRLLEFRWDGKAKHPLKLDLQQTYIWSSCTLYDDQVIQQRASWFNHWLQKKSNPEIPDLLNFHQHGGEQDHTNGFVMNRQNQVQTLSITAIEKKQVSAQMHHLDLLDGSISSQRIDLENETVESN